MQTHAETMRKAKKDHERELAKLREEQQAQLKAQKTEMNESAAALEAELESLKKQSEQQHCQSELAHQSALIEKVRAHTKHTRCDIHKAQLQQTRARDALYS